MRRPLLQPMWTECVAVGGEGFVTTVKHVLGDAADGRSDVNEQNGAYELRQSAARYGVDSGHENALLSGWVRPGSVNFVH